jgi:hypothetical protein
MSNETGYSSSSDFSAWLLDLQNSVEVTCTTHNNTSSLSRHVLQILGSESEQKDNTDSEFVVILKELSDLASREDNAATVPDWIMSIQKSNVKEKANFMKMLATLDGLRSKLCRIKLPRAISHLLKLTEDSLRGTEASSAPLQSAPPGSPMDDVMRYLANSSTCGSGGSVYVFILFLLIAVLFVLVIH